jgi:hypothetical protein
VTLKKIKRLKIIPLIFICGFPRPNANNSKAPQIANVEEAHVSSSSDDSAALGVGTFGMAFSSDLSFTSRFQQLSLSR